MTVSQLSTNVSILVVDDTPSRRAVIDGLLQSIGAHSVKQAASQCEAWQQLGAAPVDAILIACCDSCEPLELAARIRSSADHAYIPILLIVDGVDGPTASSWRDAGITDFIARPVTAAGICQGLINVLHPKHHRPNLGPNNPIRQARFA